MSDETRSLSLLTSMVLIAFYRPRGEVPDPYGPPSSTGVSTVLRVPDQYPYTAISSLFLIHLIAETLLLKEFPYLTLHYEPRDCPVLIGYGNEHHSARYTVCAFHHIP
jgi:hypothetical protein